MRAKATSVIDVLLGEAVHGSRKQRLADMKAIASVIANRAKELGVSPEEVISAPGEFSAYGKTLPAGVEAYRDLAKQALAEVEQNGPVHSGTFYATPSAKKNLPSGLQKVASTTGHIYFDDPKNRAIETALGYRTPDPNAGIISAAYSQPYDMAETGGLFGSPSLMPSANAGPAGRAYGDLVPPTQVETTSQPATFDTPTYNPDRQQAAIDYSPLSAGGVQRNQRPDESFMGGIGDAVAGYFGPGYSVSVASGKGVMRNPDGSVSRRGNHNHPSGFAADFDVIGPDGQQVSPARMADFGAYAASQGFTGVGVGPGYMEPGRMHLDVAHHNPTAWGAGGSSANMDPALHEAITQAGMFGAPVFGAGLPENVPTPTDRPLPDTLMASAPDYQTVATKQVPVGDQGGVIGASYTPPQEDAPNPFSNEPAFSAPMAGGMIGSSVGQSFQPANVSRAVELASLAPSATGSLSPDLSGIRKALDATRTTAQNAVPQPGGTMFTMADALSAPGTMADAVNAAKPSIGISGTGVAQAGIGLNAPSFSLSLPTQAPAIAPAPAAPALGSQLLNPEPLGTPELATPADFPAAPPEPTRMDRVKSRLPGAMKRAAVMGAIGGLPGAAIGLASGLLGGEDGMLGGLFDGPGPIDKFSVGSGIRGMERAMSGARGATARASNGTEYTSLGPGMGGIRTSGRFGWTERVGPDGSTRAGGNARGLFGGLSDAFNAGGGLLGDRPGGLGGLFGGLGLGGLFGGGEGNRGGFSRAERDKYGGRAGLW